MPAKKPAGLINSAETKAKRSRRLKAESAVKPKTELQLTPPAALAGHAVAARTWKQTISIYAETDAQIVSKLDQDMLVDYCMMMEQLDEIDKLRKDAMADLKKAKSKYNRATARRSMQDPKKVKVLQNAINDAHAAIATLDSRSDRKRALLNTLRQSLYLTPRSRAGVVPADKPVKAPPSKTASIIDEVVETKKPNEGKK